MKTLIPLVEEKCSENNFTPKKLVDFLKTFFGESSLERSIVTWQSKIRMRVLILQKNIFFIFEYTKADDKVKVTSIHIKSIDKIEESFDGSNYTCDYYSNDEKILNIDTIKVSLIDVLRDLTNSILARM